MRWYDPNKDDKFIEDPFRDLALPLPLFRSYTRFIKEDLDMKTFRSEFPEQGHIREKSDAGIKGTKSVFRSTCSRSEVFSEILHQVLSSR